MKHIFAFIFVIAQVLQTASAQGTNSDNDAPATVYFFRLKNYAGSAAKMTIMANDQPVARLKNASFFRYTAPAGNYVFSFSFGSDSKITLNLEPGKEYYIQCYYNTGMWAGIPVMVPLENNSGKILFEGNKLAEVTSEPLEITPKLSRIGLTMSGGIGFETHPIFVDENNDDVTLSAGGGYSVGLVYGHQFGRNFDLEFGGEFRSSSLSENLKNAKASFNRVALTLTPSVLIPLKNETLRFRAGAGPGFYSLASMKIDGSEINNTIYKFKYKQAIGFHVQVLFEALIMERGSMDLGVRYNNVKYDLDPASSTHYLTDLKNPDGSSIDFVIGYNLLF